MIQTRFDNVVNLSKIPRLLYRPNRRTFAKEDIENLGENHARNCSGIQYEKFLLLYFLFSFVVQEFRFVQQRIARGGT